MNIQFDEKIPIYIQIIESIKKDMVNGELKPGDKLPSVREMAEQYKVNPNTIQRVYQELEREKITYTQRGMGTYISDERGMVLKMKKEMARELLNNFISGMERLGFTPKEIQEVVNDYLIGGNK